MRHTLYSTAQEVRIAFMPLSRDGLCTSGNALRASRQRRLKGLLRAAEADLFYLPPLLSLAKRGLKTVFALRVSIHCVVWTQQT
jgi:hypothetical protein